MSARTLRSRTCDLPTGTSVEQHRQVHEGELFLVLHLQPKEGALHVCLRLDPRCPDLEIVTKVHFFNNEVDESPPCSLGSCEAVVRPLRRQLWAKAESSDCP